MILRKEVPMSSTKIRIHKQGEPFPIYTFLAPKKEKEIYDIYNSSFLIVGATCETAQQSMVDAKDSIRKTPLFKHKAKYHINRALELYKKMEYELFYEMNCKPKFWMDYMDAYDDLIKPLIDKMRFHFDNVMVKYKKEPYGQEKALMLMAYNCLVISSVTFDSYFKHFVKSTGKNISYLSPMKAIKDIKKEWELAINNISFDSTFDLSKYKNCTKAVSKIYDFIEDANVVNTAGEIALKKNPECDIRNLNKNQDL